MLCSWWGADSDGEGQSESSQSAGDRDEYVSTLSSVPPLQLLRSVFISLACVWGALLCAISRPVRFSMRLVRVWVYVQICAFERIMRSGFVVLVLVDRISSSLNVYSFATRL